MIARPEGTRSLVMKVKRVMRLFNRIKSQESGKFYTRHLVVSKALIADNDELVELTRSVVSSQKTVD